MIHSGWYLIAYDIAHPQRLRRLHRALRREALALQKSVFLTHGTVVEIEQLLDRLEALMNPRDDDLRAYPVSEPDVLWLSGPGVVRGALLSDAIHPHLQCKTSGVSG
jgi:CRISPR-associated protein Cas2